MYNELSQYDKRIVDYFKQYHCGRHNAITGDELKLNLGISKGSSLRVIVNRLRTQCIPICSDSECGYWYADTDADVMKTIRHLNARATKITAAENGLREYLEKHRI